MVLCKLWPQENPPECRYFFASLMTPTSIMRQFWMLEAPLPENLLLLPVLPITCYRTMPSFTSSSSFPSLFSQEKQHSTFYVLWNVWMKIIEQRQRILYRYKIYKHEVLPSMSRIAWKIQLLCLALISEFQIWQTGLKFHVFSLPFPYHFLYRLSCLSCFTGKRSSFEGKI